MSKYKNTRLIFEPKISGHHLEYIHHIYIGATARDDENFVFVLPEAFHKVKDKFEWPEAKNIKFCFIENASLSSKRRILQSLFRYYRSILPLEIIFIELMWFMPLLVLFSFSDVKISGIIYNIYLYGWKSFNLAQKTKNAVLYWLLSHCGCFKNIFILNDNSAAQALNRIWKTNRFKYLPDPFVPIDSNKTTDLRESLNINKEKIVYLHFGAMSERKGTLDIFKMIENTPSCNLEKYCIIFAGKVGDDIKEQFYNKYHSLKDKIQIIVEDDFVDYERIGSYLITCDAVLLPYHYVNVSSGVIGYCAQFGKPAIATNKGLIGKLVRKNRIGKLVNTFITLENIDCTPISSNYCITHTYQSFFDTLLNA